MTRVHVKRAMLTGLASAAAAVVTILYWPAWYEMVSVVPLAERLFRATMAVTPGVAIAVVVELLVGSRLARRAAASPQPPEQMKGLDVRGTGGDEDLSVYDLSTSENDEAPSCERARTRLSALAALDLVRAQLAFARASDYERRAWLVAERARLLEIVVRYAPGGPGDGRRLSEEASAALMRNIFGDEQPA